MRKPCTAARPLAPSEVVVSDVEAPADIGYDSRRNRVLIPLFQGDAVVIQPLGS